MLSEEEFSLLFYGDPSKYKPFSKEEDTSLTINNEVCASCKGVCCKMCGCHFSPDDFTDLSFNGLKNELDLGHISIDVVFGEQFYLDRNNLILRMRNKDRNVYDPITSRRDTECSLLTETGCLLPYEERPSGGRLLVPNLTHNCRTNYGISDCSKEWGYFQKVLTELSAHYREFESTHQIENQLVKKLTKRKLQK